MSKGAFILSTLSNALIAKISAIYGKRLTKEDYDTLLQMKNLSQIVLYLKNHPAYKNTLYDIDEKTIHRGHLEAILNRTYFNEYLKLFHYLSNKDKDFLEIIIMDYEIDELLWCLRYIGADYSRDFGFIDFKNDFIDKFSTLSFEKLSVASSYELFLKAIKDTKYYQILKSVAKPDLTIDYSDAESALQNFYYKYINDELNKNYSKKVSRDIIDYIGLEIDLKNILNIVRFKKHFDDDKATFLPFIISPTYKIDEKMIERMLNADNEEFSNIYNETKYSKIIDINSNLLNEDINNYLFKKAKKAIHFNKNPIMLVFAFLNIKKYELSNLNTIIEAVRYNVSKEKITKYLIGY